ncbi:LysR substrate-binding domain-containing protein [Luteibacter sp. RCC_6_2]|uniref:LysR substrate-binding domain-containing protein n=1 Tax=Luteibacter sp. RCC_6_2 TaxID=3239223 RepID=UPI003524F629
MAHSSLSRFQQKHPNITLHLAERMDPFVLAGSGFDAAIHFEHPAWTGMRMHRLLHEVLVPVCHPDLLAGRNEQPHWTHYRVCTDDRTLRLGNITPRRVESR